VQGGANSFQTRRNFHIQKQHSHAQVLKLVNKQERIPNQTPSLPHHTHRKHGHNNSKVHTSPYPKSPKSNHLHHLQSSQQTQLTRPLLTAKKATHPQTPAVSDYCTTRAEVEPTLKSFSEMIQKYQFMEVNTSRRASGLREKIPDIAKTLDTVQFLKTRDEGAEELEAYFELNDTLFAKAKVPKTEEVYLWLGANVMLAYPMEEAEVLLEGKLEAAKSGLENAEEDMDFLREQITVSFLSSVLSLLGLEVCVDMDQG
jgi:prefoldin subunit 5